MSNELTTNSVRSFSSLGEWLTAQSVRKFSAAIGHDLKYELVF